MNRLRDPLGPLAGLVALLASGLAQLVTARRVSPRIALLTGVIAGVTLPAALRVPPPRRAVWWISVGGRRSGWFGYAPLTGRREGRDREARAAPRPLPSLRDFVGVVPIGRTQEAGTATLTLLSLERYGDGFLVHGGLLWDEEPDGSEAFWVVERVDVAAADDRGTAYQGRSYGGGGGASWRFDHAFAPAIAPGAAELRLTVPALRRHRASPPWSGRATAEERTDAGLWTFVVPLAGSGAGGIDPS